MSVQAVGKLVGLADDSQVVRGLSRVGSSMWPPAISEQEDVARLPGLDRERLPPLAYIEMQERKEQRLNPQTLQMDVTVERTETLVKPLGYLWTVTVKMLETLEIALWGTILSVLLSVPLAYFAARNYTPYRATYTLARGTISLLRSAPELIVALFLVLAYGFGPIAGVLALGLHAAGFLGKLKTLWYGVMPQVVPQYIAYTLYILDRNVRMATVIGLVGAGGIGQELKGRFDMFQYDHVATILIAIFIVVFLLDQFSARLRARLM
jgi:phosphonate transport system permease protein